MRAPSCARSILTYSFRLHGTRPHNVFALHGGPGGACEVEPLAHELAGRGFGVVEPFQTGHSIDAQVEELREQIEEHGERPVAVVGWSWGAWLGALFAARYPELVSQLVMVGSGPLDARYATTTRMNRDQRMTQADRATLRKLEEDQADPDYAAKMNALMEKVDSYAPDDSPSPVVDFDRHIHNAVWTEAAEMRSSRALLEEIARIKCPVLAIHGDHDPHPAEGVRVPLLAALPEAQFVLLERCGHKPWREIHARNAFFDEVVTAISR